jgi:hypothetical protein
LRRAKGPLDPPKKRTGKTNEGQGGKGPAGCWSQRLIGLRAGRIARRGRGGIPLASEFLWCRGPPDSAKTLVSKGPDNPTDFSLRFFTRFADAWNSEI